MSQNEISSYIEGIAKRAKEAASEIALCGNREKNIALSHIADKILENIDFIVMANRKDVEYAESIGKTKAIIDRLTLNEKRIQSMAASLQDVIALPDPIGTGNYIVKRPNGLKIQRVRIPIGVIAFIYESRPNATCEASSLILKSGNAIILRGGKEAVNSNIAIAALIREGLKKAGITEDAVQMIDRTEHEVVDEMLKLNQYIDLVIPRGGEGLIRSVVEKSRIPVIKHDKGVCHVYVDESADREKAEAIVINAKCQRPSVCNAIEKVLIHKEYPYRKEMIQTLIKHNVEVIADKAIKADFPGLSAATEEDWYTEYLDYKITAGVMNSTDDAIRHINKYGSHHSDAIISENYHNVQLFLDRVDSATVFANASTRFNDGGELGLGAEIGISTQKIHARGPMGLESLTSEKWVIYGDGQVRE